MMSPIELVEASFEKIRPRGHEFAASFYENLFEIYPQTQHLFGKTDIHKQEKKFLNSLILLVEGLRTPETLVPILKDLGARHKGYGTLAVYYLPVGEILLQTFAEYLQADWTPEVAQAWSDTYTTISRLMLEGAGEEILIKLQPSEAAPLPFSASVAETVPRSHDRETKSRRDRSRSRRQRLALPAFTVTAFIQRSCRKILDWFWQSPTWLLVIFIVGILVLLVIAVPEGSAISKLLGAVEPISIIAALIIFIKESSDRKKEFHYQAWSVVNASHGMKVSPARLMALQDLNEDGVALNNLDMAGAKLAKINLSKAELSEANFTKSDLNHANLKSAQLGNALLARANLTGADLSHANLGFAKLSYANLSSADLRYASLICADLRHANLSGAHLENANLSGAQLDQAYLAGANLKNANVSELDLLGAYLKSAIMPDGSQHP